MIAKLMAEMQVPGLSVAMVKDDRVIYARGFGARNLKDNLPTTPDTLYGIGSCTKSFTALAVMQLVERGEIEVQDPVNKYLPFKLGSKDDPISIRNLLTMSTGIPDLGMATLLIDRLTGAQDDWIPMSNMRDLMLYINGASEEVVAAPGNRFYYLNTGYTLLGEIIERVSGKPYERYIRENILKPLRMERSTFLEGEFVKDPDIMTAHLPQVQDGELKVIPSRHPFHKFVYAPGGLLSSVNELTHYLFANIDRGAFEDARILDASLMDELHKIQFETDYFRMNVGDHGRAGYGYGWMIAEDFFGHKLVAHGGSTRVSNAQLMFVPDLKIGVAALANTSPSPVSTLGISAITFLMGKDPEKEIPDFEVERKLRMLAGEYSSYNGIFKASVVKKGSILYLESKQRGMPSSLPLIPETDQIENYVFYTYAGPGKRMKMEFTVDSSNKIDLDNGRIRYHKTG